MEEPDELRAVRIEREERLRRISLLSSLLLIIFGPLLLLSLCVPVRCFRDRAEVASATTMTTIATTITPAGAATGRFEQATTSTNSPAFTIVASSSNSNNNNNNDNTSKHPLGIDEKLEDIRLNGDSLSGAPDAVGANSSPRLDAAAHIGQLAANSDAQNGDDNQSANQSKSPSRISSKIRSKRRSSSSTSSSGRIRRRRAEAQFGSLVPEAVFFDFEQAPSTISSQPNSLAGLNKCNSSAPNWRAQSASTGACSRRPVRHDPAPAGSSSIRSGFKPLDGNLMGQTRLRRQADRPPRSARGERRVERVEAQGAATATAAVAGAKRLDGLSNNRSGERDAAKDTNRRSDDDDDEDKMSSSLQPQAAHRQWQQQAQKKRRLDSNHDGDQIMSHHNLIEPYNELGFDEDELAEDMFLDGTAAVWRRQQGDFARLNGLPVEAGNEWQLGDELESYERHLARHKRRLGNTDKLQTIYFGGFFPWLTDEESGTTLAGHNQLDLEGGVDDAEPSSMISGSGYETASKKSKQQQRKRKQQYTADNSSNNLPPLASSATSFSSENRHQLGRFILPAVRLALDHINTNNSVLSSYKLEIVPRDTQCNATISLKEFFDMVYEEPKKMLLYGDACRVSTDPIAKASYFFDLIQISYADTDPIYTIENYPNFFRVVPSENALSLARIPFIRHFNWTRVGTIYQNLPRYSLPHSKLLTDLERFNIVIKQSVSLPGSVDGLQNRDLGDELRKLKEKDVRIILGNFDEEWALLLFCEAYREKMTGRKYQWILTGVGENKLWQFYKSKGSPCAEQELLIAMDGYIITDITPVTRAQHRTISGMMAHEYSNEYKRRAQEMNISIDENKFYGYVYDGIWAIALALNRVDSKLKYYSWLAETGKAKLKPELEGLSSLLDFDYHKPIWVKLIREALNKTRFNGVTGTVSFHKNERPGLISFSQFQAFRDMNEVIIGSYDALNDSLDLKVGFPIYWRGPSPPIDYTIQRLTPFRINRTLFVIISILAIFGILLAFIFLTINIKFRNQRYIKMSSPYLNNLIIIGCILTYTSVIILGLDSGLTSEYNFPYICNARAWVLMAGFTLAFGSMFSKTFRVHSIFTNIKLHKKVIKDYKLFMVVFILLTFDVCILIVWQYFDPFYRETNNGTSIQDSDNEDVIIVPEMEHCQSKRMTIFLSVIYIYKGLLMAFGCFLAWETRHVSIPALNDSKYIGLSVYNVVIMCVIGASLSFVLRDQQDASFVIISIFIIFCSTTTLCLVFVPKLIELKQNPRAGDHRVRATLKTFKKNYHEEALGAAAGCRDIHGNIIGRGFNVNLNDRIKIMLEENVKQRATLKEKTYELEALTYKYRKIQNMIQSGQYLQALNTTTAPSPTSLAPIPSSDTASNLIPITVNPRPVSYSILKDSKSDAKISDLPRVNLNSGDDHKFGLFKSALMSSTTQLTTTNTTSSTNNTTDLTNDYSSSKVISTATTSTNSYNAGTSSGQGKRAFVAFNCDPDNRRSPAAGKQTALNLNVAKNQSSVQDESNSMQKGKESLILSTAGAQSRQINHSVTKPLKHSPKCTTDSSYCSMGADYDASSVSRKCQDNVDLFTVFSYISNKGNNPDPSTRKQTKTEWAGNNFSRWSEGPFCTLMVRKNDQQVVRNMTSTSSTFTGPGRVVLKNMAFDAKATPQTSNRSESCRNDEKRASCPDIAAKTNSDLPKVANKTPQLRKIRKNLSQQNDDCRARASTPGRKSNRLPRTISMIEYLGLNEFDMIARRHDRLQKRKFIRKQPSCCYEPFSCSYCGSGTRLANQTTKQGHKMRCNSQSEGDMLFSSNDLLNSGGELVQTSSRLSCSTCCSLNSPTFASHSELTDDTTHSSHSITSPTVTSASNESNNNHQHHYPSNSQSSTSSSSMIDQENSHIIHFCHHHQTHFYGAHKNNSQHRHHYQPHDHPLRDPHSTASSASSIYKNNNPTQLVPHSDEHSLCTSGLLYCAASKEDANDAAQLVTTNVADPESLSALVTAGDIIENDEATQQKLLIKCDVLESL